MKRLFVLCLAFLLLTGCVSQSSYDVLQKERDALLAENQILSKDNLALNEELTNLQLEYNTLQEAYDKVSSPREFRDIHELSLWLSQDDTDKLEYIEGTFDCNNFAEILMNNALKDGYIVGLFSVDTDFPAPYLITGEHAMNFCPIGDYTYAIEPQTDETFIDTGSWDSQ